MKNPQKLILPALALVCVLLILATVGTTYAWMAVQIKSGTGQLSWEDESFRLEYKLQTTSDPAETVAFGMLSELKPATLEIPQGEYSLVLTPATEGSCAILVKDVLATEGNTAASAELLPGDSWTLLVKVEEAGQGKLLIQVTATEAEEANIPDGTILILQAEPIADESTDPEDTEETTDPEGSSEPTDPEGSSEPTDPEGSSEPTDPEGSSEPTDPETSEESTVPEVTTEATTPEVSGDNEETTEPNAGADPEET